MPTFWVPEKRCKQKPEAVALRASVYFHSLFFEEIRTSLQQAKHRDPGGCSDEHFAVRHDWCYELVASAKLVS
jgi:hypothetical protein